MDFQESHLFQCLWKKPFCPFCHHHWPHTFHILHDLANDGGFFALRRAAEYRERKDARNLRYSRRLLMMTHSAMSKLAKCGVITSPSSWTSCTAQSTKNGHTDDSCRCHVVEKQLQFSSLSDSFVIFRRRSKRIAFWNQWIYYMCPNVNFQFSWLSRDHFSVPFSGLYLPNAWSQTSKRHTFRVSAFHRYHWFGVKLFPVGYAQDSRRVP